MRGAPILVLAAAAAVAVMAASALTQVGADRALEAQIAGDASAVLALSGFDGATIAIGSQYVPAGTAQNLASQTARVILIIDPNVDRACGGVNCRKNEKWWLYFCWSPDTVPQGTQNCSGAGRVERIFSGTGRQNPSWQDTGSQDVPPNGTRYLFVRVETKADQFRAWTAFRWDLTYPNLYGSVGGPPSGSPDGTRWQCYWLGSGC